MRTPLTTATFACRYSQRLGASTPTYTVHCAYKPIGKRVEIRPRRHTLVLIMCSYSRGDLVPIKNIYNLIHFLSFVNCRIQAACFCYSSTA